LRAWLEDAASLIVGTRGEDARALHLGPRQLVDDHERAPLGSGRENGGLPPAVVIACLVHALFRQIVVTGAVDDPLNDAISALRVDPVQNDVVERVASMSVEERTALASVIAMHGDRLRALMPHFQPGWLPRTAERLAIPLAGGRVVLHGTFDLLLGVPDEGAASLCAIGLTTTGPWNRARRRLHLLALLETLRNGNPPFRMALLDSGTGRFGMEDVKEEHLGTVTARVAARLAEVANVVD
jgi:hypothetical protein